MYGNEFSSRFFCTISDHAHRTWYEEGPLKGPQLFEIGQTQLPLFFAFKLFLVLYVFSNLCFLQSNRAVTVSWSPKMHPCELPLVPRQLSVNLYRAFAFDVSDSHCNTKLWRKA